jgi:hypothetical protein
MNALIRSLACGFAIALFVSAVPPANGKLSGSVTDQNGTAVSEAFIVVHWDPSGSTVGLTSNVGISHDLNLQSGKDGGYSIDLPPGFYDVFVSSMAFTPSCQKIRVWSGKSARFSPKLTVSPLVTKELADKPF